METVEDYYKPEEPESNQEEDDDDEGATLPTKKIKAGQDLWELFTKQEQTADPEKPKKTEVDKTPELDAEAPVEHLSRAEEIAISQTLAEERLNEVNKDDDPISNEHLAAINYLEAVAATGYIEEEFSSIASEYGADEEALKQQEIEPQPLESSKTVVEKDKETSGIVSYLVSRRKARLKEKDSTPQVEKDLTGEVNGLRDKLSSRESQIRALVGNREAVPFSIYSKNKEERGSFPSSEKPSDKIRPKETMDSVQAEIKAQTMNRDELLKVALQIEIEGTKLSVIYANNLLGEHGLRRVIAEYLRGGDVRKVLKKEMLEREMDFERDPILRDQGDTTVIDNRPASIEELVQKSGINWNEDQQNVLRPKESKKKSALNVIAPLGVKRATNPLDLILIFVILALLITLIVVIISK